MNARQTQIAEAAIGLILSDGIGVSTASIAKAAGVSNGTLFNAFPTKQALIDALYEMTKTGMFAALTHSGDDPFTRETLRRNWRDYLGWARQRMHHRRVMHLLLEAGLVSAGTRARVDAMAAPSAQWISAALARGDIRAPNLDYVGRLTFFHLDLVLDMGLRDEDEAMAFDMLCNAIGLNT